MEIAHFPQLIFDPAGIDALLILPEPGFAEIVFEECGKSCFCGEHSALNGQVNALEALRVQEAGRVTDDHPAVAGERRHGEPSAIGKRLGAVPDHLAATQHAGDEWMGLEYLQDAL